MQMFSARPCSNFSPMAPRDNMIVERGPERSLQMVLRPLLDVDRALQSAYQIKYDIEDLEDALEDLPMQHQALNVTALKTPHVDCDSCSGSGKTAMPFETSSGPVVA